MSWIDIGSLDDVPLRGARLVKTRAGCVAVFRTGAAQVFAASNACPHKGGPLSEGIVHGTRVTCPLHNWVFDLETGTALGEEALTTASTSSPLPAARIDAPAPLARAS